MPLQSGREGVNKGLLRCAKAIFLMVEAELSFYAISTLVGTDFPLVYFHTYAGCLLL